MASESEFVRCSCYHTEPTQNENLCLPCTLLKINIKSCFFFSKEQKIISTVGGLLLMYKIYLFCTHDFCFAYKLNKNLRVQVDHMGASVLLMFRFSFVQCMVTGNLIAES